jgi:hypothetical protein
MTAFGWFHEKYEPKTHEKSWFALVILVLILALFFRWADMGLAIHTSLRVAVPTDADLQRTDGSPANLVNL